MLAPLSLVPPDLSLHRLTRGGVGVVQAHLLMLSCEYNLQVSPHVLNAVKAAIDSPFTTADCLRAAPIGEFPGWR